MPVREQHPEVFRRAVRSVRRNDPSTLLVIGDRCSIEWSATAARIMREAWGNWSGLDTTTSTRAGISAALNRGLDAALALPATQFIAFIDSDDEWHDGKLIAQRDAMRLNRWHASFHPYDRAGRNHPCTATHRLEQDNIMCRSTTMISRRVAERLRFDESLTWCQDWDYHIQVERAFGWHRLGYTLATVHDDGVGHTRTANRAARQRDRAEVVRRWRKGGRCSR